MNDDRWIATRDALTMSLTGAECSLAAGAAARSAGSVGATLSTIAFGCARWALRATRRARVATQGWREVLKGTRLVDAKAWSARLRLTERVESAVEIGRAARLTAGAEMRTHAPAVIVGVCRSSSRTIGSADAFSAAERITLPVRVHVAGVVRRWATRVDAHTGGISTPNNCPSCALHTFARRADAGRVVGRAGSRPTARGAAKTVWMATLTWIDAVLALWCPAQPLAARPAEVRTVVGTALKRRAAVCIGRAALTLAARRAITAAVNVGFGAVFRCIAAMSRDATWNSGTAAAKRMAFPPSANEARSHALVVAQDEPSQPPAAQSRHVPTTQVSPLWHPWSVVQAPPTGC